MTPGSPWVPVIDILKNETRLEIITDKYAASCICDDSSRVEISTTISDLWIKIEAATLPLPSPLKKIDTFVKKLKKPAFKYFRDKNRTLSFPLVSGSWGNTVRGYIGLDAGSISINIAFVDETGIVLETDYTLTEGDIINNIKKPFPAFPKNSLPTSTFLDPASLVAATKSPRR